jgi:zinc transporter, ZIP family
VGADVDSAALGAWIVEEVRHSLEGWVAAVLLWGCVAASSLVLGALFGLVRRWRQGPIGVVLGFGAGALISSVSFELVAEGFQLGGPLLLTLGIGLAKGQGVSVALLVAIFVSNLPEAIGSSTDMKVGGVRPRVIILLWVAVAAVCALATVGGYVGLFGFEHG